MIFRKLFGLFFVGLLVFSLIGFFGRNSQGGYESAYRQGFIDGQQSAVVSGEAAPEGAEGTTTKAPGTQIYYRDQSFFVPGPSPLLFLGPLVAFGLLFMRFAKHGRHRGWGPHGPCGPGRGPWGPPPWKQGEDSPQEKSPDDIDDGPGESIKYA